MTLVGEDNMKARRTLDIDGHDYDYFSLAAASESGLGDISRLPFSLKVLLENLLRHEDGHLLKCMPQPLQLPQQFHLFLAQVNSP